MADKGRELKTTITLEGKVSPSVQSAFNKVGSMMGKVGGFAGNVMKTGFMAAAAGIATVGTAAVAGTKAAIELGQSFQEASNTIRIGTGATGEALADLNKSFDTVYKSVPTTMEAAAQAIADYNTRLGLTGPELENISEQAIQVNNLLGDDLTSVIEESSQAFQQWNVAAEDMGGMMDYVFKASQSTGVGFTDLMKSTQQYGAQMKEMGFGFEETVALLGQLDKAGINAGEVMGALKKSVSSFAKEGKTASEGLGEYITKIQEAGSMMEATAIAGEVFGNKAGSTMASAIREGKLSVTELVAELEASDETIMKAAADTETFPQKLQKLKATAEVALRPLGESFIDIANNAIPLISDAVEDIVPKISGFLGELAPLFQGAVNEILPVVSSIVAEVTPILQKVLSALPAQIQGIKGTISQMMPLFNRIFPYVNGGISSVMDGIGQMGPFIEGAISGVVSAVEGAAPFIGQIIEAAIPMIQSIGTAIMPIADTIATQLMPPVMQLGGILLSMLAPAISQIFNAVTALMPVVTPFIQNVITTIGGILNALTPLAAFLGETLTAKINTVIDTVSGMASGIILEFNGIITFLTGVFTADWQRAWEGIKMMFEGVWNSMKAVVRGVLNTIIDGINNIFRGINNVAGQVGDKIGLHINIPLIPKASFAEGGTVKAPTMAMIGEAGDVETVIPHKDSLRSRQLLNAAIEGVLGKKKAEEISTMIDEVEGIAAKASKSSTSAIRAFAEGGTVTSPTLAVVGEGGSPETIIPHNGSAKSRSLLDTASRAVLGRGISAAPSGSRSDNRTYNITFSPVIQGAGLADYGLQEAFEEFKRNVTAYLDERDREAFA